MRILRHDRAMQVCLSLLVCASAAAGCARSVQPALRVSEADVKVLKKALGGGDEASGGVAVAAAEPTGWGTIRGQFVIVGNPPAMPALVVDKEQNVCAPGGKQVLSEALVVDPATGGIRDVLIFMNQKLSLDDPKWVHESYAATADDPVLFDQKQCIFLSHVVAMRTTQPLNIKNSDPVGHNTNIVGSGGAQPFNQTVGANGQIVYQPKGESTTPFDVSCSIHPWMSAKMIVRNNPYFAVTKADGTFEIANVPAGVPLEFRVWQERSQFLQEVSVNGQPAKWSKGKLPLTLAADETVELKVAVDASVFEK